MKETSNIPRYTTDISTGSISNLTAIIYGLRFRFVPPRCVIRWGRGPREGGGIARFRFRSTDREDPGVNGAFPPSGVAVTGACGPPPMSPPRVRRARSLTSSLARAGEKRPRSSSRGHTSAPRFLSLTAALRNVRRAIRGRAGVTGCERLPD